ncbi:O-antigen ligase family protein [Nocardioides dokdonensis]|nr:O-antigen ligase family protein [Nocardioides dokdonensis]
MRRRDITLLPHPLIVVSSISTVFMVVAGARDSGAIAETSAAGVGGASHLAIGASMVVTFAIHLVMLSKAQRVSWRTLHIAAMLVSVYLIVDSGSRGGLIAVGVCSLAVFFGGGVLRTRPILTILFIGSTVAAWRFVSALEVESVGVAKIQGSLGQDEARTYLYTQAWDQFLEHPIFGSGVGSFSARLDYFIYPHNLILELIVDFGIFGALALVWGAIWSTRALRRGFSSNELGGAMLGGIFTVILASLMFSGSYLTVGNLWLVGIALRLIGDREVNVNDISHTGAKVGP